MCVLITNNTKKIKYELCMVDNYCKNIKVGRIYDFK